MWRGENFRRQVHSLGVNLSQTVDLGQADPTSFVRSSQVGGRGPNTWTIFCCFTWMIIRDLD